MVKLQIREFDMSTIKDDAVVLLIGKRGTGKSTMLRNIMYHMRKKLDVGIAMCPTEDETDANDGLHTFIPSCMIYDEYKPNVVTRMLKYQKRYSKRHGKQNTKRMFVIMDDCMYDKSVMKGKEIRDIHMNGRHRKIFFINAVQYLMDIGPDLRTNIDYVFALKENIISNREKLHKYFLGMFDSYPEFSNTMDTLTDGFSALVLNNRVRSTKTEDCVFWYEANPEEAKDFRLCHPIYWNMENEYMQPQIESDDDIDDKTQRRSRLSTSAHKKVEVEKIKRQTL
jgi:energy-coupling factor transporter ATP-binding protein EcfA2